MAATDTSSSSSVSMTSPSWTQQEEAPPVISVLVGGESVTEPDNTNVNAGGLKQVWGKPINGNGNSGVAVSTAAAAVVDVSTAAGGAGGGVMDTHSWPALSKAPPKSTSSDSILSLPSSHQGSGTGSISSSKQAIANTSSPNANVNHVTNTRQRSIKRGTNNGGFIQPSSQPQAPSVEVPPGKPGNTTGESSSYKEGGPKGGFGNDHQPQRSNSFNRRGGGGQHPRGDASYHHNSGGRRDQDRGNQDWNHTQQNYGSRDNYMQQQRGAHRYPRGPHVSPFIAPQPLPVRPFPNHMVFPTDVPQPVFYVQSPESLRGVVPIMPQVATHPMYYPPIPDPQLHVKIMNQIEYYFSNENLVKDTFLRRNMDEQGWVPIKLIAGFKKVMNLTDNILLILNAVQASTVVEVQNDKIRKRNEWMKWIMPPGPFSPVSSPQARAKSGQDMLTGQFQGVTLDERSVHGHAQMFKSLSGEFSSQLQHSGGEGEVQSGFQRNSSAGGQSK